MITIIPANLVILLSTLISITYIFSAVMVFRHLKLKRPEKRWQALTPALLAILLQAIFLQQLIYPQAGTMNLGFFTAFSLICWLVSIQIMLGSLYRPLESLGIIMFPVSGLSTVMALLAPASNALLIPDNPQIQGHIMISVIAYSLIMLSALQALTLAYQDHAIRNHHPGGITRLLPPLHDMEVFLFQLLTFGFVFLSISLASGFYFVDDLFAQHLVHKTVLSIAAWIILSVLLFGRYQFGWRGKLAIRWTLTAFVFMMLAYFGSKLVLEFILK